MKRMAIVLSMAIVGIAGSFCAQAEEYTIDPTHSSALFKIKHMDVSFTHGAFTGITGSLRFDPQSPEKSLVEVTIKTDSVNTFVVDRDTHLKSPDFFDVQKYPKMSFKSTSWEKVDDTHYAISGSFTLLGVTKPLTVQAHYVGTGKGMKGETRIGFEAEFTIKRSDFGMTKYLPSAVGDEVVITISLEGIKQAQ